MRKSILWFVLLTLFEIPYVLAQNGFRVTGQIISADDNQPGQRNNLRDFIFKHII